MIRSSAILSPGILVAWRYRSVLSADERVHSPPPIVGVDGVRMRFVKTAGRLLRHGETGRAATMDGVSRNSDGNLGVWSPLEPSTMGTKGALLFSGIVLVPVASCLRLSGEKEGPPTLF
jgi:hypothetical protein